MYPHTSFKTPDLLTGVLAGTDLSAKQYYAVMYDTSDEQKVVLSDGTSLIGWLMNAPEKIGVQCEVATIGGGAVGIADGTITVGDKLTLTSAGKVKLAVAGDPVVAKAMETVSTDDNVAILPIDLANIYTVQSVASVAYTGTEAEMNKLDDSTQTETVTAAGAVDANKTNTNLDSTIATFVATLATCPATMIGKIKTIRMSADNGDVTIALTNVQGGTAATTATFSAVGNELILVGSAGGKWTVVKEFGVVLS